MTVTKLSLHSASAFRLAGLRFGLLLAASLAVGRSDTGRSGSERNCRRPIARGIVRGSPQSGGDPAGRQTSTASRDYTRRNSTPVCACDPNGFLTHHTNRSRADLSATRDEDRYSCGMDARHPGPGAVYEQGRHDVRYGRHDPQRRTWWQFIRPGCAVSPHQLALGLRIRRSPGGAHGRRCAGDRQMADHAGTRRTLFVP